MPLIFFFFFVFLGPHPQHMEGSSQAGVESEQQLPAYTTATATRDSSRVFHLHHSSGQRWILNPGIEPASSWILIRFVNLRAINYYLCLLEDRQQTAV